MTRTPVGSVPYTDSRAALFAFIAARLSGHPDRAHDQYFRQLGLRISGRGARRAAEGYLVQSPHKNAPGPTSVTPQRRRRRRRALRPWLLVNEHALGLETALVRFPGSGQRQDHLRRALERLPGVRHVIELQRDRELLAVVVFSGVAERLALQAQLEEIAEVRIWDDISYETLEPSVRTWIDRAKRAAGEEGLRLPRSSDGRG